jgi:TP901 family phage tail tape measure protein
MSKFVLTAQLQLQAPNNVKQLVQQIQSQLNGVSVNIQVQNAGQAQKQIQQVAQATNQATTAAERMGKAFALSIRRFAAFSIATRAVGLFTSTLSDAVQTSIDFERQLIKVSQVTGKSLTQLRGLTKQITDLSTGFGVASSDLLNVSTILAQAGLSAEDTAVALRTLAKSALAPNFDSITETAEGAIAVLAQFQEGVGSLEKQLGSINAVAGAFAVEAGDLIDVIRRTGGVFKASGGDLNELLALFTSVRATTRESAESIGTGLRTIFTRIQRPKTIEFLKQFGVELVDLNGKFVGPYEAVKRLSEALSGLGEGDTTFIRIAEELGGFRQIGKVLPLLQQFSTAQSALNVAMKAGDSLTQDAASSQAALAIRIMKVKEEFLALVRSITETSTFQVMANTALSLASALIKIGDSIKPLLPMLAALSAFKLVKGMSGFFGGMMSGAASGRTYNKGGKVLGFARGGLVPGTGNGDTVPAMLAPGEFVIRKSSVNKMGAGTLAAMNENRYADGGPMTTAQKIAMARGPQRTQALNQKNKKAKYTSGRDGDELRFSVNDGNIGAFFMNKEGTQDGLKSFRSRSFDITNSKLLSLAGVKPYKQKGDRMAGKPDTFSAKGILEAGNIQTFYPSIGDIKSGSLSQIIQNNVKTKLSEAVMSVANEVSSKKLLDIPPIDSNDALLSAAAKRIQSDSGAIRTTSGYLYEGVIDALTGARPASGNSIFDFPASSLQGNRGKLAALFGNISGISKLKQADAKASYSSKIIDGDMGSGSISSKIINSINNGVLAGIKIQKKHFGGLIQKFAEGGEVLDRGSQKYLISDVVKGMRELQGNPTLSQKDAIDLFNSKDARGDFIYTNFGGKGSIKLPKWMGTYRPQSAAYGAFQVAQANKQNRISDAMRRQGKSMRDYESRREFATGGGVGTDTVPALLTPGEFVVNRKSAQRIGYGALHRMNKVGKYAKGGVVNGQNIQRFFVGGQADKDAVRAQGTVLTNIGQAEAEFNNIMGSTAKSLRDIILSKFEGIKEIKGGDTYKAKDKDGFIVNKSMENTRGIAVGQRSMGFQIKGKNVAATTETVAHETGHVIDTALGGGSKKASNTQGTFQFDLVEKVKPQMEAAFKAAGMDAQNIEKYLASNEELFAEFFAKASPEVRAIITATTDSKIGMQKLADHLEKAGHTYAGLESSDITGIKPVPTPTPVTPPKKPTGPSSPSSSGPPSKPPSGGGTPSKTSSSTVATSSSSGGGGGGMFNDVGANIAMVSAALSTMLPPLDENAGALTKVGHSLLTLGTTVGGVIFTLGQFGIQLKAANIASFAKSLTTMGKGGLGEMIGGFTRQGGKTSRAAGESVTQAFGIGKQRDAVAQARSERASQLLELRGQRNSLRGQTGFKAFSERADVTQKIKGLAQAPSKLPGLPNSLTGKLGNFLGQKAAGGGLGGRLAGMAGNAITKVGGLGTGAVGGAVGGAMGTAAAMAGPALAVVGAVAAINSVIGSFRDLDDKLKSSIEAGKVEEASRLAVAQKASEFPLIGNIVSSIFGESGDAFLLGIGELFGGPSLDSVKQLAAAQAGAAKTTKSLEEAQKVASDAMNDFKNGSISAADALAKIRAKTGEASNQQKRASSFVATNLEQRGGISRDIFTLGGLLGETSTARNKRLGAQNVEQINQSSKFMADAFNTESEARQATIRSGVARGKNSEEIRTTAMGNLRSQREEALKTAKAAAKSGDTATYDAAIAQAEQLRQSMEQVDKEIANIEKEVKRQKELYDAMNLGLRSATATATALSASMDKFSSGLEVGGSTFVSDVEFLQSAMSSAAQAMDSGEIQSAVKGVSDNLREFGSSEQYIKKFEGNVAAFTQAQSNYTQAFANIKKSMKDADFKNLSADDLKKKFADELTKDMGDGEAKKSLKAVINSLELGDEDVNKILAGDLSVFGDKLSESQKKMLEDVQKIAAERAKAEQVLIDFTKKRIDAERNLVQAQQEALDLVMEGREIQGKYGGQAVTGRERKDNLLAKSNVESSRLGLTNMKSGDVGDLRRRNSEIMAGFSNIEARRSQQGGMKGRSGVEADEAQKDLQKAYKTQIDTIRGLIKLEEEQLKITQEKNKLEKDSMESLVKGDIEDFFKKQSAVGATAAIASGDTRLQNLYGGDALGAALQDIQRQQEAGVQSLYGQQLAGSGGLTEAAANAALSSRGVTDMRAAQVMAGTTAEEEASKARLRELGGMLGETGNMGTQMAEMQVETATINVNSADLKFKEVMAKGNKAAAEAQAVEDQRAMARGGMVYASRGIFVPRGTDTIPAMLTPGEFVVNRGAVQRGNNLQILKAMNSGLGSVSSSGGTALMASGGVVRYRDRGSYGPEQQSQGMSNFATALENFNRELSRNVESLKDSKITIKLDSTNVNINLNDGGLLKSLKAQVAQEIFNLVKTRLVVGDGGRLRENSGVV